MSQKEWMNIWNLFDQNKTGTVNHIDFKHIVRSLGRKYTETEFDDILKGLPDHIPYSVFLEFMSKPYTGPTEEDLRTALQAFDDTDSGFLKISELTTLLTTLGEKMPPGEVKQLLSNVKTDEEGKVSIDEFVKFLTTPVPPITPNIEELQKQLAGQ